MERIIEVNGVECSVTAEYNQPVLLKLFDQVFTLDSIQAKNIGDALVEAGIASNGS